MAKTPSYKVDYNDPRFAEVKAEEKATTKEYVGNYDKAISQNNKEYDKIINQEAEWAEKQQQLQQERTDFTIDTIEQKQEQAHQDYLKEQSGAYVDWKKQSDRYGVNAEQMAANGLDQSGYSESSQVSMYNTYQNRVAMARESWQRMNMDFENAMTEARLQNSSILAEIAYNSYQKRSEFMIQKLMQNNQLLTAKMDTQLKLKEMYNTRWQSVLQQINTENSMAEQVRQFNESLKVSKANLKLEQDKFKYQKDQDAAAAKAAINKGGSGGSDGGSDGGSGGSSGGNSGNKNPTNTAVTKTTAKSSTKKTGAPDGKPPVDMKNLTELGLAGKSAAYVNRLVENGQLKEYVKDGKTKFIWVIAPGMKPGMNPGFRLK
jgi:hypothetical protein